LEQKKLNCKDQLSLNEIEQERLKKAELIKSMFGGLQKVVENINSPQGDICGESIKKNTVLFEHLIGTSSKLLNALGTSTLKVNPMAGVGIKAGGALLSELGDLFLVLKKNKSKKLEIQRKELAHQNQTFQSNACLFLNLQERVLNCKAYNADKIIKDNKYSQACAYVGKNEAAMQTYPKMEESINEIMKGITPLTEQLAKLKILNETKVSLIQRMNLVKTHEIKSVTQSLELYQRSSPLFPLDPPLV
jgi:hypothetical protein